MEKYELTLSGKQEIEQELKHLIDVVKPEVIRELILAREQGDLSENADYDAAKNKQAEVIERINELQNILNNTLIIDDAKSNSKGAKVVELGKTVTFKKIKEKKEYTYKIVGEVEANPSNGKIAKNSPIAKSIIGKTIGEIVKITGVEKPYEIEIVDIK
jgi:transcription elongation factor GreA